MNLKLKKAKSNQGILALAFGNEVSRALVALTLIILLGVIFNADGAFFKIGTHRDTMRQASEYGILACGMTLVIITGGIDLAVGSVVGLTAVAFSIFSIHLGWPAWLAIIVCILVGGLTGLISGGLIAYTKLQPFIATLAMFSFARGLARFITDDKKVTTYIMNSSGSMVYKKLPEIFGVIDNRILGGNVSVVSIIFLVCFIITWVLLSKHKWGRELYAMGGNEESARLSGIRVKLSKTLAYVFCGLMCGIAGICEAAQQTQGDPYSGTGYELTAIAMVVIGGTSMSGGRGGIGLTFLGVLIMGYLEKVLSINAIPMAMRLMITGIIIVVAVLAQRKRAL
jgi:ribose transport system permease protein